jgi:hypothetical protein
MGVDPKFRNQRIGQGVLVAAANERYQTGYAYAVVGNAATPGFFTQAAGADDIPDWRPGAYFRKI